MRAVVERNPNLTIGIDDIISESITVGVRVKVDSVSIGGGGVICEGVAGAGRKVDAISVVGVGGVISERVSGAGREVDATFIVEGGSVILYSTIISSIMPENTNIIFLNPTIPNSNIIITIIFYAITRTRTIQSSSITNYLNIISINLYAIR